jgi:squalene-associated FAD-dependent desaturase
MSARIAVVGGGLAGITAALHCADAGRAVTLFEARPRLGGLTHSFRRGELHIDNGQHVFLRCCTAYRSLLHRLGVADLVTLQHRLDIPVRSPLLRRPVRLRRRAGLPAPAHLGGSLLGYRLLRPAERIRFARAALALRRVDATDPATDAQSFGGWLAAHGQSARAVEALWDLVGVATLNATAAQASLALAATVFQEGLLTDPCAADLGWSRVPLSRLHGEAAQSCLNASGVGVRTGARVEVIEACGGGWLIGLRGEEHVVDQVVVAVPAAAAERLLPPDTVALPGGWSDRLGSSPIVNVHVVYDRRVLAEPFVAGVGTPVQWVFDRTIQSGLGTQPGRADDQYLAISLSAADRWVDQPTAALRERLLPALEELLPAVRRARVRDFFVTRERHATFRPAPGTARLRPPAGTARPGLYLAGAWTATGWPDTMEGAVRSGEAAAVAATESTVATESVAATESAAAGSANEGTASEVAR